MQTCCTPCTSARALCRACKAEGHVHGASNKFDVPALDAGKASLAQVHGILEQFRQSGVPGFRGDARVLPRLVFFRGHALICMAH